MRTILRTAAAALLIAACGCSSQAPGGEAARHGANQDAALARTLTAYTVEFLRRNPTTNTYLGGAGFDPSLRDVDGTLRDFSPAALDAEARWLSETSNTIEAFAPEQLSSAARIDRDVALAQIRFMLHQQQARRYQERALDTFVSEPFRAIDWQIQGLTETGDRTYGTADEWNLVIARVNAVPGYLATAQQQIQAGIASGRVPDRRMLERDGLETTEANAKYFAEELPALGRARISGTDRDRVLSDLTAAGANAAQAYRHFHDFVRTAFFTAGSTPTVKPAYAADRFAMGEDEYNWALRNNMRLDKTATQLFDESMPIVLATEKEMVDLARGIGEAHHWALPADGNAAVRAVFDELSKDYPKSDAEMVSWYRDAAFRLVDYARKTGLFDVPADYKLDVTETPAPLQSSIDGAAYYPAPPFKTTGVGRFYVSPTHNDRALLQANNRAALADLSAHEGFPGHDWYYKVLTEVRDRISPVRWLTPGAVEDSSAMWEDSLPAEGWGLYSEALMAEPRPNAPTGFYSPEEHLYQLQGTLYRDLRVRIDTGIHTGRMGYDEATTLFSEIVDFLPGSCGAAGKKSDAKRASCEAAERAIFRYSKWPTQAITYRLGKDQIYALREEAAKQLGAAFSAKAFHLAFIRQGTIPSGYFREPLLGELAAAK
ncbi:MAG: DUF885 domain-containing protein [Acidobacteriaceae bacterium]|jgi:uncharacterized protein (DUF885 family)|nr:DUF885 domain-containing protein [Acidobacteriaceae bacterium]